LEGALFAPTTFRAFKLIAALALFANYQLIDAFDDQKIIVAYIIKNSKTSLIFKKNAEYFVMENGR
jgi:hypothetical protein